jgi:hypothetical protein
MTRVTKARLIRRWLFHLATGVSAGLLVLMLVMWVRSYWRYDMIGWNRIWMDAGVDELEHFRLDSGRGGIGLQWVRQSSTDRSLPGDGLFWWTPDTGDEILYPFQGPWQGWAKRLGFEHHAGTGTGPSSFWKSHLSVVFPYWVPALLFGVLPIVWIRATRRRRRRERIGLCAKCGYDLRASRDRCPECGTAIEVEVAA